MAAYQESRNQNGYLVGVKRASDGAFVPADDANIDYQAYKAWVVSGNSPDPDPKFTIDAIREHQWELVKAQRDNRKSGGVFVDSFWIHTDDPSRIQWLGIKDTARDNIAAGGKMTDLIKIMGQTLLWKTLDNQFVPVTNQLAFDVVQATKNLDAILFSQAETKRAQINMMSDPTSLDTTKGWNKTYTETVS